METAVIILAVIGAVVCLFGLVSVLWGIFGPKERIGLDHLKKRLRQLNVDPKQIRDDVLREFACNALLSAYVSERRFGRYDATEYKRNLDWRAELIRAWIRREKLDSDSEKLVKMIISRAEAKRHAPPA